MLQHRQGWFGQYFSFLPAPEEVEADERQLLYAESNLSASSIFISSKVF